MESCFFFTFALYDVDARGQQGPDQEIPLCSGVRET